MTKELIKELNVAVEAFKKETKESFVSKTEAEDFVRNDKIDRINDTITEVTTKLEAIEKANARPQIVEGSVDKDAVSEDQKIYAKAWEGHIRGGNISEHELRALEQKALTYKQAWTNKDVTIGTPGAGGFAVPEVLGRQITNKLLETSMLRPWARVISVANEDYRELHNTRGTTSGWVGETDARGATASSTLVELTPSMGEIYAFPQVSQTALEDIFFNVEAWVAQEVADEFAVEEGLAFVTGNGTNKPKGYLAGATAATADSGRAFGTIEHVESVVATDLYDSTKVAQSDTDGHRAYVDLLIDQQASFKSGFTPNLRYFMNRLTMAKHRKLRDVDGNLIWERNLQDGPSGSLLGVPVTIIEDTPAHTTDTNLAVAIADMSRAYTIVDRVGVSMIRDNLTNKPHVGFYTRKRVGGYLTDSEALKVIKIKSA